VIRRPGRERLAHHAPVELADRQTLHGHVRAVQRHGDPCGDADEVVAVGADRVLRALGGLQPGQEVLDATDEQLACGDVSDAASFCCISVIMQQILFMVLGEGRRSVSASGSVVVVLATTPVRWPALPDSWPSGHTSHGAPRAACSSDPAGARDVAQQGRD
jgi:hypothetical protein